MASTRSARFALGTMFIDLDTLDLHELQTLADSLPSPHTWAHGIDDIFYCLACHASFVSGEPVPEGPCESDSELLKHQGAVTIDVRRVEQPRGEAPVLLRTWGRLESP